MPAIETVQRCIDSWFWRIHELNGKKEQLNVSLVQLNTGIQQLKNEKAAVHSQLRRWTLWQDEVQKAFGPLIDQHRSALKEYEQVSGELGKLKVVFSQATSASQQQPDPEQIAAYLRQMWGRIYQGFQSQGQLPLIPAPELHTWRVTTTATRIVIQGPTNRPWSGSECGLGGASHSAATSMSSPRCTPSVRLQW